MFYTSTNNRFRESSKKGGEMSFLPDGEVIPAGASNYMKFTDPENRFRVLDSAITGYELWVEGKPIRNKRKEDFTLEQLSNADINKFTGKRRLPQYFWAFPVYNYKSEKIEILEVTQMGVMNGIKDYLEDPDYGDPKEYDLIAIRDDEQDPVKYRVKAKPPKELDPEISKQYRNMNINLAALYKGDDPFKGDEVEVNVDDIPEDLGN